MTRQPNCQNILLPGRRLTELANQIKKVFGQKINWQESYTSLILGAIIVIILGLLVANFFSKRNELQQISTGEQTQMTQQAEASPSAGSEYTIRANDSLSKISEAAYGSQDHWMAIASVNDIKTPNIINQGDKIKLPAKEDLVKKEAMAPPSAQTSYDVVEGDTFFTISEKMYGDGSKWTMLFAANGSRRLPNGNPLVFAGTTITIPR